MSEEEKKRSKDRERVAGEQERERRIKRGWTFYMIIGFVLIALSVRILLRGSVTSTKNADAWLKLEEYKSGEVRSLPKRGNIYADNGEPLAISIPKYDIRIDFRAGGFSDSVFLADVDAFAGALAEYFTHLGDDKATYKRRLLSGHKRRTTAGQIVKGEITDLQLQAVRNMPYLKGRSRHKTGFHASTAIRRVRPYENLAKRTVGFLQGDTDSVGISHGSSGLELGYDSLLCGAPGVDKRVRVHNRDKRVPVKPAKDGMDIHTTINIDIQDIAERALKKQLVESNGEWGFAVVMEVETGAIKAISNLDRISEGIYQEVTNHAVANLLEPGSTFKSIAMLIALNEGYASPEDSVETGNGVYQYKRGMSIKDHNWRRGGYGTISLAEAIWFSSNIGVAKTILRGFEGENQKYMDRLNGMNIFDPISIGIPGEAKAFIKDPKNWEPGTMAWSTFGYEVQMPALYMLRFYNAIANDGKMMEPYLVASIRDGDKEVEHHKPTVVNKQIARKKSVHQLQEMLRGVVVEGTGKNFNSPYIAIAGKTGTANLYDSASGSYGGGNMTSFCAYYPYEDPLYTCYVVINRPAGGSAVFAGRTVREIAEQTVATTQEVALEDLEADSLATFSQYIGSGWGPSVARALKITDADPDKIESTRTWLQHHGGDSLQILTKATPMEGEMPDLIGMAGADAIYLAEKLGLRVSLVGRGAYVKRQSVKVGTNVRRGQTIQLTL